MKILHTVESYDPASHGMQQVVKQLSERLYNAGHDITVATSFDASRKENLINGVKIEEFRISGKEVSGYKAEESEIQRYKNFLINGDFDVVTNFAAQQWATDIALPILKQIKAVKVFVPTGFSEIRNLKFSKYFESMKTWMRDYDMNVFLSEDYQDVNFARENGIENIKIIPNAASAEEFVEDKSINIKKQLGIAQDKLLILHVGSHTGLKGHKQAISIFKKAKIKNVVFLIVGNTTHHGSKFDHLVRLILKSTANLFSFFFGRVFYPSCSIFCSINSALNKFSYNKIFNKKELLVKNLSREETVAAYMEADLFLFPSNIECSPLVLFECMASKTPFLTTDVGNTREIILWSNSGKLLKTMCFNNYVKADIRCSSRELENFILDIDLRKKMEQDGFNNFNLKFSWQIISDSYLTLYKNLIESNKNQKKFIIIL
jgi:glycosyltransferase involved in cell wall biosynthesis